MFIFIIVALIMYIAIVLAMAVFQRNLLYLPDKIIETPQQYGLSGFDELFIKSKNELVDFATPSITQETIQLWYKPSQNLMPTIIYFHGNASHIGNRSGILSALSNKGLGVLAVSYRGYGKSTGNPSEQGLYTDARSAINFLVKEKNIALSDIIIYGESLGSGVAIQMASEMSFGGLILQAPYTSITNRAAEIYWFLPVKLILRDNFDSINKIEKIQSPLLIFHGELDTTIPVSHGKAIFNAAPQLKKIIYFPDVEHNNFDSEVIADDVLRFVENKK